MDDNTITLNQWLEESHDEDEKRTLYLYGDMALAYLHDRNVVVNSFNPKSIFLIDGDIKKIMFSDLRDSVDYDDLKNNLFEYAVFGISMFINYFDYLEDDMLKDKYFDTIKSNFEGFLFGIPKDDVNYFKGVIQSGSFVYFNEFDFEYRKKKLKELSSEVGTEENVVLTKTNNDYVNQMIYTNSPSKMMRSNYREAAFVEFMYYPVIISLALGIILLIAYCFFGI